MRTIREALEATLRKTERLARLSPTAREAAGLEGPDGVVGEPLDPGGRERLDPELLESVRLRVRIELGRARARLSEVLALRVGDVIDLQRRVGDPVEVFVQDLLIARGELVVAEKRLCVRIREVMVPFSER